MDLFKKLQEYGGYVKQVKPDRFKARPINMTFNEEGIKKFNEIYQLLKNSYLRPMKRTPRGSIAQSFKNNNTWDCIDSLAAIEITVYLRSYLFVYRIGRPLTETSISGWESFKIFKNKCLEFGIDLSTYIREDGKKIKETIEPPLIYMKVIDKPMTNIHHIDFHSSYPAGLANTHKEFKKVIKYFYDRRKDNPKYKGVLNCTIGFMQSIKCCGAKWAHLSKDAISDNNKRVKEMAARLARSGRYIIGFNTDGIWYQGPLYHGSGEGDDLGQWSNDHKYCKFRAKSDGSYEFIEDGKYYPVLRGFTKLDTIKSRDTWEWGDIYRTDCEVISCSFDTEKGVVMNNEKEEK